MDEVKKKPDAMEERSETLKKQQGLLVKKYQATSSC